MPGQSMIADLDSQLDLVQLLKSLTALKKGNFLLAMPVSKTGVAGKICDTLNEVLEMNLALVQEIQKLSTAIGKEGNLTQRLPRDSFSGDWAGCIDAVNALVGNLVQPTNEVARVIGAVALGDLSQTMSVEREGRALEGEFLRTANIVNGMVKQLSAFGSEVTRVAREVGTEGKLGGQAEVTGVSGIWKNLTDNVNSMAWSLTAQVRDIVQVTTAVARGDLTKKIVVDAHGEILELKNTINTMVDQLSSFASEVTRMAREVGTEGKLGGQAMVGALAGTWRDLTDNLNAMASNLTSQLRNSMEVTTAVARGDLSKKITSNVRGEFLELKNTINTMVDQLQLFASEVSRMAREVGTEGKLGGQAQVKGAAGTWKDLTDNVNSMASNLTSQLRDSMEVTTAVARGDLTKKITSDVQGEFLELKDTINTMVDQLSSFASEVTRVAREAGVEGKLGGQARTPGAAGMWRDLTENVNQLAGNLTTQVRSIAEFATGVIEGDLSRSITIEAQGEVASLNDNLNQMIRKLKETTRINTEQDWLKTNLAKFARLLQGQRDLVNVSQLVLSELAPLVSAQQGAFYFSGGNADKTVLKLLASYAGPGSSGPTKEFEVGQGLVGQCAAEQKRIVLTDVPEHYIQIASGLGSSRPTAIVVIPVLFEGQIKAVIELASFQRFTDIHLTFLDQLVESIGIVLNTIGASMRTEEFLKKSQTQTEELRGQQEELTLTNRRLEEQARSLQTSEEMLKKQREELQNQNEELAEKARLLAQQKDEVEQKNLEVGQAKQALEEKAEQLSITSKYKSEFLANMSHEIRTPLNSILILSKVVSENSEGRLTDKQVEFMKTIYSSGSDLLGLINDILDLSKVESGTMSLELSQVSFQGIHDVNERTFREVAGNKGLQFSIEFGPGLGKGIQTDVKRLQQILGNLLSNAFKFTEKGEVVLRIGQAQGGWDPKNSPLRDAESVVSFSVSDDGIGIPEEKHAIIFEAFQQADGTTSRKYGGTGLGLSISREVAHMLGGEIRFHSEVGQGSTFILYLPTHYSPVDEVPAEVVPPTPAVVPPGPRDQRKTYRLASSRPPILDDRLDLKPSDKSMLIIEPDFSMAELLLANARRNGFKGILAGSGENGFELAKQYLPTVVAIDSVLPDSNAWTVVDRLKHQTLTRHIPVIAIVSGGNLRPKSIRLGIWAYLEKPVEAKAFDGVLAEIIRIFTTRRKVCLLVKDDSEKREEIARIIRKAGVDVIKGEKPAQILAVVDAGDADCVVLDTYFTALALDQFLAHLKETPGGKRRPSLIFYSETALSHRQETALRAKVGNIDFYTASTVDQVFEWVTLDLHIDARAWDKSLQKKLESNFIHDPVFSGKTVHIVDDDIRNIFALTAVLETYQMKVTHSEDGQSAIEYLRNHTATDLILMDIMMPRKDGYETMGELRELDHLKEMPMIALTAKAMKGDREKCIAAGATDYITKPVETDKLISLIRTWLQK